MTNKWTNRDRETDRKSGKKDIKEKKRNDSQIENERKKLGAN